jgi:hypothetical protein
VIKNVKNKNISHRGTEITKRNNIKSFGKEFEKEPFIKRFVSSMSGCEEKNLRVLGVLRGKKKSLCLRASV